MDDENNFVVFRKSCDTGQYEYYVFLFPNSRIQHALTMIDYYAVRNDLSLTCDDAAVLRRQIAKLTQNSKH
jgi:hypothetical protein